MKPGAPPIDIPIDPQGFSEGQEAYWRAIVRRIIQQGTPLTEMHLGVWRQAIENTAQWQPGLSTFLPRVKLAARLMEKGERPVEVQEADGEERTSEAVAMRCMVMGCVDGRAMPYVHDVKWWGRVDPTTEFAPIWTVSSSRLKTIYHHPEWKKRIEAYGFYVCWQHYYELYKANNPEAASPFPREHWYNKRK